MGNAFWYLLSRRMACCSGSSLQGQKLLATSVLEGRKACPNSDSNRVDIDFKIALQ